MCRVQSQYCIINNVNKETLAHPTYLTEAQPMSLRNQSRKIKKCTIDKCENKKVGLGYCHKHYSRYKKYGNTELPSLIVNYMPGEKWKDIDGYNGRYRVSNLGRVSSYFLDTPRILKESIDENNYRRVTFSYNGARKSFQVHRLVAIYFIPLVEGKDFVNHIDLDKSNNVASNLEWCTHSENMRHNHNNGVLGNLFRNGESYGTILNPQKIRQIRIHNRVGIKNKDIAEKYGVDISTIQAILNNKIWRWVK